MKSKFTRNGKIRGRPPKGSKAEVQKMPPDRSGRPLSTMDIIKAELSKRPHYTKAQAKETDSAEELEREIERDRRRFHRHRNRLGLK